MKFTENFNLNKPEGTDPMRIEDFNQNTDLIDAALALCGDCRIVTGSFTGTGVSGRTLELGFTPRVIILVTQLSSTGNVDINIATADFGFYLNTNGIGINDTRCVEGGVYMSSSTSNSKTYPNNYIAFV